MSRIEFEEYIRNFRKRPILVEQEAQILKALIDGNINKNTAVELLKWVIEKIGQTQ